MGKWREAAASPPLSAPPLELEVRHLLGKINEIAEGLLAKISDPGHSRDLSYCESKQHSCQSCCHMTHSDPFTNFLVLDKDYAMVNLTLPGFRQELCCGQSDFVWF
ncbi:hypothetical protein CHS0354_011953 [Potamilus streckersoni]|uniref:Uncharacterized protein n=1 Tax=Potamilus streckersoni TaxID=2493646 RepID=A0AAE0T0G3_9BIVA|nr:hypothetical protein CHS0354_011953 [Potamilus streckersoni]